MTMKYVHAFIFTIVVDIFTFGAAFQPNKHFSNQHITSFPTLFVSPSKRNDGEGVTTISEARRWLIDRFGCTEERLGRMLQGSQYQATDCSDLKARADWLQQRLDLTEKQTKKLIQKNPTILSRKSETLEPKLEYLQSRLELTDAKLRSMITKEPQLLKYSIDDNIERKLCYLQKRLHLNQTQVAKLILKQPSILGFSVESKLEPNIAWLQERLKLTDAKVSKIIWKAPNLLYYSISDKMEPNLDWLQKELKLSSSQTRKIAMRLPTILACSIKDNMKPTLTWLKRRLLLKNNSERATIIEKFPALLGLSIENNLEPTLDFYSKAMGDEQFAIAMLKRDPIFFGYSLKKRLKPRLKEAKEVGWDINEGTLAKIARYTELRWNSTVTNNL